VNLFDQLRKVTAFNDGLRRDHPELAAALFTHPTFPEKGGALRHG
jgi:hypothetical protein